MRQQYDLENNVQRILATLNEQGNEEEAHAANEDELQTIHVYPVEGGGILFTKQPIEADNETTESDLAGNEPPEEPISPKVTAKWEGYSFPLFILFLCLFLSLDMLSSYFLSSYALQSIVLIRIERM